MKHSITRKITLIIISLIVGTVLLCWFLNTTLLESYYINSKQESLKQAFLTIDKETIDGSIYKESGNIELEKISAKGNIMMLVMNAQSQVLFHLGGNEEIYRQQFWDILFAPATIDTEVIEQEENYSIGRCKDARLNSEYLILIGNLSDGNLVLMRAALESIRESVAISNRFLAYVGLLGIVISTVISFFVTRKMTGPIRQLAMISQRMTKLDFDAKFQSKGKNEIDVLGEHMNELSQTLEKTISELKTANNELKIDIEKKNQIDDMRKDFLSNVSHELKTPLALIQGYAEGLKECVNEDSESREFYCDVIMEEAEKMNRMVKQLLTLNQLEFGNDMVSMERFDLTELIRGVIQATGILQEQEQITVQFEEQQPLYVWADEFKTEEVLMNYMSNAIHYAAGEKIIKISLERKDTLVRVSVFNTGFPIPQEDLSQIWVKFYKVDKARTREYGGSGIGLSIVKAIMDSFHQACGVINHEDGVEFWFELDCQNQGDIAG